jgi:hypothetical protein
MKRLHFLQCSRMIQTACEAPCTSTKFELISVLREYAISSYTEIRKHSQNALSIVLRRYPPSKFQVFQKMVETIYSATDESAIKGAVHVLKSAEIMGLYIYNMTFFAKYVLVAMDSQARHKASISQMFLNLHQKCMENFIGITNMVASTESREIASEIIVGPETITLALSEEKVARFKNDYENFVCQTNLGRRTFK